MTWTPTASLAWLRYAAGRRAIGRHSLRVWLIWGAVVLVLIAAPVALIDPAVLGFVVDPELCAAVAAAAVGLVRASLFRRR
jgi:uncharacterized membrane protein